MIELLGQIRDDVAVLRQRAGDGSDRPLSDRDRLDATKYTLVTSSSASIRVAQHIAASEGWEPPATNAHAFRVLADNGVIDAELAVVWREPPGSGTC